MKHTNPNNWRYLVTLAFFLGTSTIRAQQVSPDSTKIQLCATRFIPRQTGVSDSLQRHNSMGKQIKQSQTNTSVNTASKEIIIQPTTPVVYKIPVIFHILYSDPDPTTASPQQYVVPEAQVQSQLAAMNEAFRLLNADASNTPLGFSRPADAGIEFCLATRDPQGNRLAESGIDRVHVQLSAFNIDPTVVTGYPKLTSKGGTDTWPPGDYLNVWVCSIQFSGAKGIATFPQDATATEDGIIVQTSSFGRGFPNLVYHNRLGRVLVHELGHYFNLHHIWGDTDPSLPTITPPTCSDDDGVSDTPVQYDANVFGIPCLGTPRYQNNPGNQCSWTYPGDMFMNYMDNTSDPCKYMFTQGQVDRMRAILTPAAQYSRASLLNSLALAPTRASITHTLTSTVLCAGDQTSFRLRAVLPDGTPCAGSLSYQWTVPPGWSINIPTYGLPTITPNGTSGGTVTLLVTYTNGNRSVTLPPVSVTFTFNSSAAPGPVFNTGGDMCLGDTRTFAVNAVPGASTYNWQVPAGFTIQGAANGSSIQVTAPGLTSGAATTTPYTLLVNAAPASGCPTSNAAYTFWLGTGEAAIDLNPIPINFQLCANSAVLATASIPSRNQGTNTNFRWTQFLLSGTPNGCQNQTVGNDTYTYPANPNLPPNQMYIGTGLANNQVRVQVDFDNSCGGHKQAIIVFNTVANLNGVACAPDSYCRPALVPTKPYPNPTTTGLVTVEQLTGPYRVYNAQGRTVKEATAEPGRSTLLDLRRLPVGIYQVVGQDRTGRPVRYHIQYKP